MINNWLLDETAATRNKRNQLDHLLRIAAPHERIILTGIGLIVLALVVWASFGSIVRSVTTDGVLVKPGVRYEVITTEIGHLVNNLVVSGDRVEVGDPIARQTVPELDREIVALRDRMELLGAEIRQSGGDSSTLHSLMASTEVALLQMEARRSTRELIVSQVWGEVMALNFVPGEYLPVGAAVAQIRDADRQQLQAVLQVEPQVAQRIQPGMLASVEAVMPGGEKRRLNGEVASVTAGPLPNWLVALQPSVVDFAHRIDVVLHQASDLSIPDGNPCQIRIVLGRYPFTSLFDTRLF